MHTPTEPELSFVVEWDNTRGRDVGTVRMLAGLADQIARSGRTAEVFLVFDEGTSDSVRGEAQHVLEDPDNSIVHVEALPAPGLGYYEQKNLGARRARGDLVIFVDSDVVPEPEWLERLLTAFDDPDVEVCGGTTYIVADDWYGRTFALTWVFGLRTSDGAVRVGERFWANNVALRHELVARYPFPEDPRLRGPCGDLARQLREDGHTIWIHPGARVAHPPPPPRRFARRAVTHGHSAFWNARLQGRSSLLAVLGGSGRVLLDGAAGLRRLLAGWRAVGLRRWELPAALALFTVFLLLRWAGLLASAIDEDRVRAWCQR